MGFISRIQERQREIAALIAVLVAEREELDIAERVAARLGDVGDLHPQSVDRAGLPGAAAPGSESQAKVSTGNDGSNAPLDSAPVSGEAIRPSDGGGTVDHAADTSGTMSDVSAAMTSLLGETGAASHFQATGKPGAASSDKAAPAPSIVSRLRALNAEHPEFTARQAANELGLDVEKVRTNSYVNKIKWAHSSHFARRLGGEVAAEAVERRAEANEAFDEPSPAPEPKRAPVVKSGPAMDAPRIPRPLSGSKFHLVNDKGEYLNRFCAGFTRDRRTAWIGTEQQLTACRRNFDIARDLTERAVGKELPPVPVNREVA